MRDLSRRNFAALLGGAALAASAAAQAPGAPPATAAAAASSPAAETDAKVARILALYGERLGPEQRDRLRRTVQGHVEMLAAVRAVPVVNSDPPAAVLRLVRGEEDRRG